MITVKMIARILNTILNIIYSNNTVVKQLRVQLI